MPQNTPRNLVRLAGLVLAIVAVLVTAPAARADLVRLREGGEVRGKVEAKGAPEGSLVIRTLTGGAITLDRELVEFQTPRPISVEEYELRSRNCEQSVPALWELAEWCRQKNLTAQRKVELQRVVALDPDHEKAHYGLGHSWIEGKWVDRDAWMSSRGYVKYRGKYVTQEEYELLSETAEQAARQKKWIPKIRNWNLLLVNGPPDRAHEALQQLQAVDDPDAVHAVAKFLLESDSPDVRVLGINTLVRFGTPQIVPALVKRSLFDEVPQVRETAVQAIPTDYFADAMQRFVPFLRHERNDIINRAAIGLRRVATREIVPHLINALVTTHIYQMQVEQTDTVYSFSTNGGFGSPGSGLPPQIELGLRTGQYPSGVIVHSQEAELRPKKIIDVSYDHANVEVLATLRQLTGQNFQFDGRSWRLWWAADQNGVLAKPAS